MPPAMHPRRSTRRSVLLVAVLAGALCLGASAAAQRARGAQRFVTLEGVQRKWHPLTLTFATEVETDESVHAAGANPFLDFALAVTFTHPASATTHVVPGYFAADGAAADTGATAGDRWRVRFAPDRAGRWEWRASFRRGPGVALAPAPGGVPADPFVDGANGAFRVGPAEPAAPGFLAKGRLEHVDAHYWKFAESGESFLKSGAGGPENFLAYFEFDGTLGFPANYCLQPPDHPEHLHRYEAHAGDYVDDAVGQRHTWGPGTRGRNILGAIDYLASAGVNSFYFITNTYHADGDDVWPWVTPDDKLHFDVSKLEQWERVLAHLTERGLSIQLVFEENENDQLSLASGGLGYGLTQERHLYYREMVARFAHHPAVHWVIGDESNYWDEVATMESLASAIRALDPYDHPLGFHSKHPCGAGCPDQWPVILTQYAPYFGFEAFESSVYQTVPGAYNTSAIQLVQAQSGSRRWAHYGDEQSLNAIPTNLDDNRRKAVWGNLMGGGAGVAWYPGNNIASQYPPGVDLCDYFDVALEDFRVLAGYFEDTAHAVRIFQEELPYLEMAAANELASPTGPQDYVFHRPEDEDLDIRAVYAVYRGFGDATDLSIGAGTHDVEWFNPRTGAGPIPAAPLVGPGPQPLPPPAEDPGEDWLAIVRQL